MSIRFMLIVTAALLHTATAEAASTSAGLCDSLAASPLDLVKPADVPGIPFDDIDSAKAVAACLAAVAETPTDSRMLFQLGRAQDAAADDASAVASYRKAADAGHVVAINNLGALLEAGRGAPQDLAAAADLYRRAADAGLDRAKINFGNLLRDGKGVAKDPVKAFAIFQDVASRGDGEAMYEAGLMLEYGDGVPEDIKGAFELYSKATGKGHVAATESLASLQEVGRGTTKDEATAAANYRKAIDGGSHWAKVALAGMMFDGRGVPADKAGAFAMLKEGLADKPTRTDLLSNKGYYYSEATRQTLEAMLKEQGLFAGTVDTELADDSVAAIEAFANKP